MLSFRRASWYLKWSTCLITTMILSTLNKNFCFFLIVIIFVFTGLMFGSFTPTASLLEKLAYYVQISFNDFHYHWYLQKTKLRTFFTAYDLNQQDAPYFYFVKSRSITSMNREALACWISWVLKNWSENRLKPLAFCFVCHNNIRLYTFFHQILCTFSLFGQRHLR